MKITENEEIKEQKHDFYEDFELQQYILSFENQAEKVVIRAFDKDGKEIFNKEFQSKFSNSHLNIAWQDKGIKAKESLYEMVKIKKEG